MLGHPLLFEIVLSESGNADVVVTGDAGPRYHSVLLYELSHSSLSCPVKSYMRPAGYPAGEDQQKNNSAFHLFSFPVATLVGYFIL